MDFIHNVRTNAQKLRRILVLPEGTEPRTIQAARTLVDEGLVGKLVLLGERTAVPGAAQSIGVSLEGVEVADPGKSGDRERYAALYYELRKHKGMTEEEAFTTIVDPLRWGAMMVRTGGADAMVAGAVNATSDVLRASLTIIKTMPGIKFASSCFVMKHTDPQWGVDGHMIFADCAIIPDPDPMQLAEIAISSADSCKSFLGVDPIVAMLSFSTLGSAEHADIDKVRDALAIVKERRPDLNVDGELQVDAALMPSIGTRKAPESPVAGKANVLVFPDLGAGNIGYKLVQRLAGADAFGPFLQGFAKPVSDLSRGCSVDDIVNTAAATLCQGT